MQNLWWLFGVADVAELEDKLVGKRYDADELRDALNDTEIKAYFGNIDKDDFLSLIY